MGSQYNMITVSIQKSMMLFINLFKLLLFHSVSPFSLLAPNRCSVKKVPAPLGDGRFFRFLRNSWDDIFRLYIYIHIILLLHLLLPLLPVVPHKAVAEVSKIENLWERLVVVMHGWQSELMHHDAPKRG